MMTRPSTLLLLHAAHALLGLRSSRPKTLRQVSTLESPKTATRRSGLSFLPPSTIKRAEAGNPIEKNKLKKGGDAAWTDVYDFAAQIRAGTLDYDQIEDFDINQRLKWVGMLSRFKKTPGRFMMRLRTPNGIVKSDTLRLFADTLKPYGDIGVLDITTRQNIQLRGLTLEDGADLTLKLHADHNMTSFQSALDNARNVVGSPLAGLDDKELVDTRPIANAINDLISLDKETGQRGNPQFGHLGRKFNIAVSGGRDDFAHTYINDIGLEPVPHRETGEIGFNVVVGGPVSASFLRWRSDTYDRSRHRRDLTASPAQALCPSSALPSPCPWTCGCPPLHTR